MIEMGSKYGNISATDILSSRTKIGFERRFSHVSTASEDSIPGVYSRRRARVIDLNSSDLFEDIIDEMR